MEMLEGVRLTPEEWTPENGMVTAAQKVQRIKARPLRSRIEYD